MERLISTAWSRVSRALPTDAAINLAVFRIVVALLFLTTGEVRGAAAWATLPSSLAVPPRGWGWALALCPANLALARAAWIAVIAGAVLGAVGLFARVAFGALTVAALYLLALPLRSGLPYHYQHLVWFAALCAVSPCADALAVGRCWRRRTQPPPPRSAAYGVPLRVAWLLVGVIFFFPACEAAGPGIRLDHRRQPAKPACTGNGRPRPASRRRFASIGFPGSCTRAPPPSWRWSCRSYSRCGPAGRDAWRLSPR